MVGEKEPPRHVRKRRGGVRPNDDLPSKYDSSVRAPRIRRTGKATAGGRVLRAVLALSGAGIVVFALVTWWGDGLIDKPSDEELAALALKKTQRSGIGVYQEFCAYCHGFELDGQSSWKAPLPDDAVDAPPMGKDSNTWKLSDDSLFGITKLGGNAYALPGIESKMPAFEGILTDPEIWEAVAYIKKKWPPEVHEERKRLKGR